MEVKRPLHSHEPDADIDDEYHAYVWGEESPRAFARSRKLPRTSAVQSRSPVRVVVSASDPGDAVPR